MNAFTTVTAVKRRVTLPKQIIINPKIHVPDSRPSNRALFGCFPKRIAEEEENGGVKEAIRGVLLKMSLLQCTHQSNPEGELIKMRLRISLKIFVTI